MPHYATLSGCCSAPCLVRGTETKYYACAACKEPTTRKRTVLDTKEKLQEFLDSRPVWSYTASTTLTKPGKSRFRSSVPLLFKALAAVLTLGILAHVIL